MLKSLRKRTVLVDHFPFHSVTDRVFSNVFRLQKKRDRQEAPFQNECKLGSRALHSIEQPSEMK